MKLKDITNSKCDVRNYMKVLIDDEVAGEISDEYEVDYDTIMRIVDLCDITVSHENLDTEIVPFDLDKFLDK